MLVYLKPRIILLNSVCSLTDDGHSFDQVLFYGNEMTLLLFDMLTFCIADYICMNYIVAGVITYLLSEVSC